MKRIILLGIIGLLMACDLEKEVQIDLPVYESQLVVECYLQPNQTFSLLLSNSSGYFEPFAVTDQQFLRGILEDSAEVVIRYADQEFQLENNLGFNPFTRKLSNYNSFRKVPVNYEGEFELEIVTKDGETVLATTRILPVVPIDSVVVEFNDTDTLARVLTYFTDVPDQTNFYRRQLHLSSLDSLPKQDFTTDDRVVEDVVVFGTGYDFARGDTLINTIYHIDEAYYNFLESVEIASSSNGNPFGQPSPIVSKLGGTADAIGVFAGLSYDRVYTFIRE